MQGSHSQYPLALCYAITAHKAQSLTMDKIVVHCSEEFTPGQTYVAISRVKREKFLQILGFHQQFLLPPRPALAAVVTCQSGDPVSTFDCCKNSTLDELLTKVDEDCQCSSDSGDDSCNHELSHPPVGFTIKNFLSRLLNNKCHDQCTKSIKAAADYGIKNLDSFELLSCILWHRIADVFQLYLTENLEEVHMTNKNFTCAMVKVNELFITNIYRSDMINVFNVGQWSDINSGQRSLSVQLVFHLYQLFTAKVGKRVRKQEEQDPIYFNVADMEAGGLGKITYVGGWAIQKLMDSSRRCVIGNKSLDSTEFY
ncbi:Hypothetical predicted protein [Paramuricea clavata]|uniref:Uncharacterized protein n=1 Tax=Paramuricea clavata TaxID=317549 RepID=A0A7D9HZS6_PARCT|nr:Hypothetical predicted protein [Paramuricea clavata]